jgi:hypothetical protein
MYETREEIAAYGAKLRFDQTALMVAVVAIVLGFMIIWL